MVRITDVAALAATVVMTGVNDISMGLIGMCVFGIRANGLV